MSSRMLATACLVCLALPAQRRGFCTACEEELPWQPPGCYRCAVALPGQWANGPATEPAGAAGPLYVTGPLCSRCNLQAPAFNRCHCTFAYESPVSVMIRQFKDRAGFPEFRALSSCFIEHFLHYHEDTATPLPDLLLPVPMHSSRIQARGFNQALLLAKRLSRRTGIPVLDNSCHRQHRSSSQRGLNAGQRLHNMQGIFSMPQRLALTPGKRLAIIDDVVTTTATAQAMATVMQDCDAASIDVWALARSNHQPES